MPKITGKILDENDEVKEVTVDGGRPLGVEKFQVTDKAIGLAIGNEYDSSKQPHPIQNFGNNVPLVSSGAPSVDRNPYNFIPLDSAPWMEKPPHPDHSTELPGQFTGWLDYTVDLKTPLFVPEGFPDPSKQQDRTVIRHFCRMRKGDDHSSDFYAIPGSTLKGVVRSEVEAITNSLFGVVDVATHKREHLYRRRALKSAGVITEASAADGNWKVKRVQLAYVSSDDWPTGYVPGAGFQLVATVRAVNGTPTSKLKVVPPNYTLKNWGKKWEELQPHRAADDIKPYHGGLLDRMDNKGYTHLHISDLHHLETRTLPKAVVENYKKRVLEHRHFRQHFDDYGKNYPTLPIFERVKEDLQLKKGDLVFFTEENGRITTIGKNINYLWPAKHSAYELAKHYFPQLEPDDELRGLRSNLTLADRMFGFAEKHTDKSHPYKGRISFEPAYGRPAESRKEEKNWHEFTPVKSVPPTAPGILLRLAPLTGPSTLAKSRPLYLEARPDGKPASYDDEEPKLRGRKAYWHQNTTDLERPIWEKHLYDPQWHTGNIVKQCPPPLCALTARRENKFTGRIRFRNLTEIELGALLHALEGPNLQHCLKLGKGKPRGLGSVRFSVTSISKIDVEARYTSLDENAGICEITDSKETIVDAFTDWQSKQHGAGATQIREAHTALHEFPNQQSVRYFPINFNAYGWLPNDSPTNTNGEPKANDWPVAMSTAYATKRS